MWNQNFVRNYPDEVYLTENGRSNGHFYENGLETDCSNSEFQNQTYDNNELFLEYQTGVDQVTYDRFGNKLEHGFGQNVANLFNDNSEPVYYNTNEYGTNKPNNSYITWNNEVYLMNENCYLYNNSLIPNSASQAGYQKTKKIPLSNNAYNCVQYEEEKDSNKFWTTSIKNSPNKHFAITG